MFATCNLLLIKQRKTKIKLKQRNFCKSLVKLTSTISIIWGLCSHGSSLRSVNLALAYRPDMHMDKSTGPRYTYRSCVDIKTQTMKLPEDSFCADVKARGGLEPCSY